MLCPNCGKEIKDESTSCPECGSIVNTANAKSSFPNNIHFKPAEIEQFRDYALYSSGEYSGKKTNWETRLTRICIVVCVLLLGYAAFSNFSDMDLFEIILGIIMCLFFGVIAGVIIAAVLSGIIDAIIPKKKRKVSEEVKSWTNRYYEHVIGPLDDAITQEVLSSLRLENVVFSLRVEMDKKYKYSESKSNRDYYILSGRLASKNIPLTLGNYRIAATEECRQRVLKLHLSSALDDMDSKLKMIDELLKQYPFERYSRELITNIEECRNCSTLKNSKEMKRKTKFEKDMLDIDFAKIDDYLALTDAIQQFIVQIHAEHDKIENENEQLKNKIGTLKERIKSLKKKICSVQYYSKKFRSVLNEMESFLLQSNSIDYKTISIKDYRSLLEKVEKDADMLEELYLEEHDDVETKFKHNRELAEKLKKKLDLACADGNDVKYSYSIEEWIQEIEKRISSYEQGPDVLNVENVEACIQSLIEDRKKEREAIFKTIRDYEQELHVLHEKAKYYERPNAGKLADKFLERIKRR